MPIESNARPKDINPKFFIGDDTGDRGSAGDSGAVAQHGTDGEPDSAQWLRDGHFPGVKT
jgi:hypothetical protein